VANTKKWTKIDPNHVGKNIAPKNIETSEKTQKWPQPRNKTRTQKKQPKPSNQGFDLFL
jgi:hypothetical protein